jgi:hypothetical protein
MGSNNSSDAADIAAADRARASSVVRYPAAVMDTIIAGDTPMWVSTLRLHLRHALARRGRRRLAIAPPPKAHGLFYP